MSDAYRQFLEAKVNLDEGCGFAMDPSMLNPALKPLTHAMVTWALAAAAAAADACAYAAKSKARLKVLRLCADIGLQALIKLKSPGCKYLGLCDEKTP